MIKATPGWSNFKPYATTADHPRPRHRVAWGLGCVHHVAHVVDATKRPGALITEALRTGSPVASRLPARWLLASIAIMLAALLRGDCLLDRPNPIGRVLAESLRSLAVHPRDRFGTEPVARHHRHGYRLPRALLALLVAPCSPPRVVRTKVSSATRWPTRTAGCASEPVWARQWRSPFTSISLTGRGNALPLAASAARCSRWGLRMCSASGRSVAFGRVAHPRRRRGRRDVHRSADLPAATRRRSDP